MPYPVIIVGGGLAGLMAAHLIHRTGIDFQLLEARDRLGGRILSVDASGQPSTDGFDLGPSWFWPAMQPAIADLVKELQLPSFPQNDKGDIIFQRMSREVPQRYQSIPQEPQSMRLVGGIGAIISALASGLPASGIRLGARVTNVTLHGKGVEVKYTSENEPLQTVKSRYVIFALPPRLLATTISFTPALDAATVKHWANTPTWMAPHAKFFAIYDAPFWLDMGLSGTAQSMVGPLVEIHDATTASGQAALFGFIGVPAPQRLVMDENAMVAAALEQLASLFGPQANHPRATLLKDWAKDPLTATADDQLATGHLATDERSWVSGKWQNHIFLAGSETSSREAGYLSGAVEAARRATADLISKLAKA